MNAIRKTVLGRRRQQLHNQWRAGRSLVVSGGSVGADIRRLSASSSSSFASDVVSPASSLSVEFAPLSSNNLAWGAAAASATISLVGYSNADRELFGNDLMCNRGCYARGYHSSTALCESNSSNQDKNKESDGPKTDSFFDLAQQWASDYATSKKKGSANDNETAASIQGAPSSAEESIQTPEDLLEAMGILGGSSRDYTINNSSDEEKQTRDKDERDTFVDEDPTTNLKGMMRKVLFKFDEFQSTLPKSSKEEGEDCKANTSQSPSNEIVAEKSIFSDFVDFANNAQSLFQRKSNDDSPPDIEELIQQAQSIANHVSTNMNTSSASSSQEGLTSSSSSGFLSQVLYFQQNAKTIQQAFESSFGPHLANTNVKDLFQSLPFTALHYYLESQDSIKTPSWKRRKHRFQQDVDVLKVEEVNEALILSELSYADSVEDIREGLDQLYNNSKNYNGKNKKNSNKPQWELLFCDTNSRPNQPSHFLAIQKNASPYDDALHVLVVVRGTKSMSDLITDGMMEAAEYEYAIPGEDENEIGVIQGKAHSGMVQSGKYLVERHEKLLQTLLKLSKKRKLEITLIGHSLGAGAATIAAMEWNSRPFQQESESSKNKEDINILSAHVVGFGCPALLSQPLSLATKDYVTTVIADADFIPRMSGATLVNLLLDVNKFDYRRQAERDVEQALRELQGRFSGSDQLPNVKSKSKLPFNIDEDDIQTVMGFVHRGLEKVASSSSSKNEGKETEGNHAANANAVEIVDKMKPVLFPPGNCVHFYRDGIGISGTYVPCTFFNEIDVARTMIDDHLISSGYRRIFLSLMRDFHKDDHFSFESKGFGK